MARLRRRVPIFVCRKCLKRAADGDKLYQALKAALKQRCADSAHSKPRVVMTSCLGLCPKHAITVTSAATLACGKCLLLAKKADADGAAARLLGAPTSL